MFLDWRYDVGFKWIFGRDKWVYLFNNISKFKEVPEIFKGTPFQKVIEMSRISELPKEVKEDWKKELDENIYVQQGIEYRVQQRVEEVSEKIFNEGFQEGAEYGKEIGLEQGLKLGLEEGQKLMLQQNIAQLRASGLSDQEIISLLKIDSVDI